VIRYKVFEIEGERRGLILDPDRPESTFTIKLDPDCPVVPVQPSGLNQIDREICKLVGLDEHKTQYCLGWFDMIGFKLACGESFEEIIFELEQRFAVPEPVYADYDAAILRVAKWLKQNFKNNAWVEIGRRA